MLDKGLIKQFHFVFQCQFIVTGKAEGALASQWQQLSHVIFFRLDTLPLAFDIMIQCILTCCTAKCGLNLIFGHKHPAIKFCSPPVSFHIPLLKRFLIFIKYCLTTILRLQALNIRDVTLPIRENLHLIQASLFLDLGLFPFIAFSSTLP